MRFLRRYLPCCERNRRLRKPQPAATPNSWTACPSSVPSTAAPQIPGPRDVVAAAPWFVQVPSQSPPIGLWSPPVALEPADPSSVPSTAAPQIPGPRDVVAAAPWFVQVPSQSPPIGLWFPPVALEPAQSRPMQHSLGGTLL